MRVRTQDVPIFSWRLSFAEGCGKRLMSPRVTSVLFCPAEIWCVMEFAIFFFIPTGRYGHFIDPGGSWLNKKLGAIQRRPRAAASNQRFRANYRSLTPLGMTSLKQTSLRRRREDPMEDLWTSS